MTENNLDKLLLRICKRKYTIAWIALLVCLGFSVFLFSYPLYSGVGFVVMIVFCALGFYLFSKLPEPEEENIKLNNAIWGKVQVLYQNQKKDYLFIKKVFTSLLIIFDIGIPIISTILYYIYDNIQLINYPLAVSLLITGIIIFIWLRRSARIEALRKLINKREN